MKFFLLTILLSLMVFGLTGCPGNATNTTVNTTNSRANLNSNSGVVVNSNGTNLTNSNMNMSNSMSGSAISATDFMTEAAKGGMAEVERRR